MESYQRLEAEWAEFNGLDPNGMVACSSGTAALHLALESFCLPPNSEVITPDFTMVACARAVTLAGTKPVFVDCDERLMMDVTLVESCVREKLGEEIYAGGDLVGWKGLATAPWVIMPVHVYGRQCDMDALARVACKYDLVIVEDLAEAHSVRPHPSTDAACWSFFKNNCDNWFFV